MGLKFLMKFVHVILCVENDVGKFVLCRTERMKCCFKIISVEVEQNESTVFLLMITNIRTTRHVTATFSSSEHLHKPATFIKLHTK